MNISHVIFRACELVYTSSHVILGRVYSLCVEDLHVITCEYSHAISSKSTCGFPHVKSRGILVFAEVFSNAWAIPEIMIKQL